METPRDAFILCHACNSKNGSDATHCSQCKADLLPGRSAGQRLGAAAVGICGLILIPVLWWCSGLIGLSGGILWYGLCMIPLIMILGGFGIAVTRTGLVERLMLRAERHLTTCPNQAVLDFTTAFESAGDDMTRYNILEKRGEALMKSGKLPEALSDFEACLKKPEPEKGVISADKKMAHGAWEASMKRVQAMIDEINSKMNP